MNSKTIAFLFVAAALVSTLAVTYSSNIVATVTPHYCETAKTSFKYLYREFYVRTNADRNARLANELIKVNEVCQQSHGDTSALDFEVDPAIISAARNN